MTSPSPPDTITTDDHDVLNRVLDFYRAAKEARESGLGRRDDTWNRNSDSYWGRSSNEDQKADWQANVRLPKTANFVERFAASQKLALAQADPPFTMRDAKDSTGALLPEIERTLQTFLARCGENDTGQPIAFPGIYGEIAKSGALKMMAATVTWRDGRLRIDPVDPGEVFLDPTRRRMYRIRRYEIDWHRLEAMKDETDSDGEPIWNLEALEQLQSQELEETKDDSERLAGHEKRANESGRKPIVLLEFLGHLTGRDGKPIGEGRGKQLIVVANDKFVIRGPEPNPFDHGQDWLVVHGVIGVPFSVYARAYVELFEGVAEAFQDLMNVLLDGAAAAAANAYEWDPDFYEHPDEIAKGIHGGKMMQRSREAVPGERGVMPFETGKVDPGAIAALQALSQELREAASQSELRVGQLASGETTATEILDARQGSEVLDSSITMDIEDRFLSVIYYLSWMTIVQNLTDNQDEEGAQTDEEILAELPPETVAMLIERREEFLNRRIRFTVRGLSGVLERRKRSRALLSALQIIGSNEILAAEFAKRYSIGRALETLMRDMGAPVDRIEKTPGEIQQDAIAQAQAQAQQAGLAGLGGRPNGSGSPPRPPAEGGPILPGEGGI